MFWLLMYALIAVGMSFLCSVLEAVLLSVPPSYVAMRSNDGSRIGKKLKAYKEDVDQPLAAILTLNTFAHTIGAAGVGAEAAQLWGNNALGVVSAVMTVVILIASEIIPKTLGAVYWRRLITPSVRTLQILVILLWPLVKLCGLITVLLRPSGEKPLFQREDFRNLTDAGHHSGILKRDERIIISNLLKFNEVTVRDIMTPLDKIIALPGDTLVTAVNAKSPTWWTSRIPVFEKDINDACGYAFKEDILSARLEGRNNVNLGALQRPLGSVDADDSLDSCYHYLASSKGHIALVRDETKNVVGVVTMEDIIETMFGLEIDDEDEPGIKEDQSEAEAQLLRRSNPDLKVSAAAEHKENSDKEESAS